MKNWIIRIDFVSLWVDPVAELLAIVEICVQTLYPTKLFPF